MLLLYRLGIALYLLVLHVLSLFNAKAKQFTGGRKSQGPVFDELLLVREERVWFHFPSLGEFEQGRPVLELYKAKYPDIKIVVTFFSPSGYENRKNYPLADYVLYLPMDGRKRSLKTIAAINPRFAVFTKYDFWYYYFFHLNRQKRGLYVISAIFRPGQVFFKPWGALFRRLLSYATWLFVQDEASYKLLKQIGIKQVAVSGDTRFDRVLELAAAPKSFPAVAAFCSGAAGILVAGSTWPADEDLLSRLITDQAARDWKFIIAPHELSRISRPGFLEGFDARIVYYSDWVREVSVNPAGVAQGGVDQVGVQEASILVIDNIGMLSSLYAYGQIGYIGGGFGSGIHNILEAGAAGIPVLIGPNYTRFKEARDMIQQGGALGVTDTLSLSKAFETLSDKVEYTTRGNIFKDYIASQAGASARILAKITQLESSS